MKNHAGLSCAMTVQKFMSCSTIYMNNEKCSTAEEDCNILRFQKISENPFPLKKHQSCSSGPKPEY